MIKLGKLILDGTPCLAVGFKDGVSAKTIDDIQKNGLDIVELRIDSFSSFDKPHVLKEISKFKNFPIIATIRSSKEGGGWNLSETDRLSLFEELIPKVDVVDIELSSEKIVKDVVKTAHKSGKLVLISYHNFDRTPDVKELNKIISKAKKLGADIVKIATLALKREDIQKLAAITLENKSKNLVTIAMGAEGVISRILFPALGSLITYASLGQPTAPGQLDLSATFDLLRKLYPGFNEKKIKSLNLLENV